MILYKYTADCSKLNLEQEDSTKEGYERLYSRRSDAAEWNSKEVFHYDQGYSEWSDDDCGCTLDGSGSPGMCGLYSEDTAGN